MGGKLSRLALLSFFVDRQPITLTGPDGSHVTGVISSLEHEDGSGYSFNVVLRESVTGALRTVYVRTVRSVFESALA